MHHLFGQYDVFIQPVVAKRIDVCISADTNNHTRKRSVIGDDILFAALAQAVASI